MTEITDRMDDRALRKVEAVQVENPWMLDYVRGIAVSGYTDVRYAPPGVDAATFAPVPRRPDVDPYILCVARLSDPRKRADLLLSAYAKLPSDLREKCRLVLAGLTGPSREFWKSVSTAGLGGRVSFVAAPDLQALKSLYQRASVFALPSDEEGLGVVLLEAMACAVPVVATRCGGPEGIVTDGHDGFLVPLDDDEALSLRLQQLLEDPDRNLRMGDQARATIEHRYAEQVAGQAFIDVWDRLLDRQDSR